VCQRMSRTLTSSNGLVSGEPPAQDGGKSRRKLGGGQRKEKKVPKAKVPGEEIKNLGKKRANRGASWPGWGGQRTKNKRGPTREDRRSAQAGS